MTYPSDLDIAVKNESAEHLCWPIPGGICFHSDGVLYVKPMSADDMEYFALRLLVAMRETRHSE
jgi:hypothetical protein